MSGGSARACRCAVMVALVLLPVGAAWAGPPYFTDDPEPVEYRHWEFYLAAQYAHGSGGTMALAPHFELNYGAAPNVQLHVIAPLAYSQDAGGAAYYGYGDTELGVKVRLVQETPSRPQVGVFPHAELPTGDASRGLGNGRAQFFLPVWLQKSWGKWSSYAGGGYWRNPGSGNRDWWFAGWQAQYQTTKHLALGAELYHQTPNTIDGRDHTGFNVGAVYDIDEGHHLLFSVGRAFDRDNPLNAYAAYQLTW